MFKFGFKASLNFYNGSRSGRERDDIGSIVSIKGAYRTNRDEFFGSHHPDPLRKSTPALQTVTDVEPPTPSLRPVKSTSDLIKTKNLPPNLRPESPGVSQDPRGAELNDSKNKTQEKGRNKEKKLDAQKKVDKQRVAEQKKLEKQRADEQKKLDKQRQVEQKKREKLALQEQVKQEKIRKEREKKEAQQAKRDKKNKKTSAPPPPPQAANPLAQANPNTTNPLAQGSAPQYSTNTLDSSISKSSGPPPYDGVKPKGDNDSSGNVTYVKPEDTGSWDMISKHRQNINRPTNTATQTQTKQTKMDLKYKVEQASGSKENSEA